MMTRAAGILALVACVCFVGGPANAETTYFSSDFNSFADTATVVNGGSNSLTAYGLPNTYGIIRPDGSGGKALTIYGGEQFNGAASGAFGDLSGRITSGEGLLRMTGVYRTQPAYDATPWNQTARIQFQNSVAYFTYNEIVVSASTPDWTPFTLDLDIGNLDPGQLGQVQANFFIPDFNPGEFQVDNLLIQSVPEPSTLALFTLGGGMLAIRARRRARSGR